MSESSEPQTDNPNHEAARWRTRLREVEAERDQLGARLQAMQRAQAEQVAGDTITPQALWATTQLDALLDDDGNVDPDRVTNAVKSAQTTLGINPNAGLYVPAEGYSPSNPTRRTFRDAFDPNRNR